MASSSSPISSSAEAEFSFDEMAPDSSPLSSPAPITLPKRTLRLSSDATNLKLQNMPKPHTYSLRRASFFNSFVGRNPFDADDDEFNTDRKYTTATLRRDAIMSRSSSLSDSILSCMTSKPIIKAPEQAYLKPDSSLKQFGQDVFRSFRGRSAFDADDDEFNVGRKYTLDVQGTNLEDDHDTLMLSTPQTPVLTPSYAHLPRANSPVPLAARQDSSSDGSDELDASTHEDFATDHSETSAPGDEESSTHSPKLLYTPKSTPSTKTSPRSILKTRPRKVSWADETSQRPLFEQIPQHKQQTSYEVNAVNVDRNVGPVAPGTATFTSNSKSPQFAGYIPQQILGYQTIRKTQGRGILTDLKKSTHLDVSPAERKTTAMSNMWDPEDDTEWDQLDAYKVNQTFRQSYSQPVPASPTKPSNKGYFDVALKTIGLDFGLSTKSSTQEDDDVTTEEQLAALNNTFFYDPNGDICDQIMKEFHVNDRSATFVPNASTRAMHIIDMSAYFSSEDRLVQNARPRLGDAVATILAHTSHECLNAFLDPKVKEFVFKREVYRSKSGLILVVRRAGNEVICGVYSHMGFSLQWSMYVKSLFSASGLWSEVYASTQLGSMPVADGVPDWSVLPGEGIAKSVAEVQEVVADSPRKLQLSPSKIKEPSADDTAEQDSKFWLFQNRVLARYILRDAWRHFNNMWDCHASWEADGEVSKVRLVRSMILAEDQE